jgi:hypothetical protein
MSNAVREPFGGKGGELRLFVTILSPDPSSPTA